MSKSTDVFVTSEKGSSIDEVRDIFVRKIK